ncbi:MAG TPA: SIMPL domain-containing protein [Thermomicrobiales bacterium]|nr:SIMPL domain-containing protein [Thermomicrobiales bacterium]
MRRFPILSPVFALALLLFSGPIASAQSAPPSAGITVTGIGSASAPAETAIVVISIGSDPYMYGGEAELVPIERATPIITVDDVTRPVVDALVSSGVSADDIEVISNPYAGGIGPYGIPYSVMVQFTVDDPTTDGIKTVLDPAIQAAVSAGLFVNMTSAVYGIADCPPLQQEARVNAVSEAQATAAQQADALGVPLGDVVASRDTPSALYSGPWYGSISLNSCTPGVDDLAAISTWGGPIFDPQQPAEVSVQTAIEITFDIAGDS